MTFPQIKPMPLTRLPGPFSDPDWIFEVKYDGFRSLCYVQRGAVKLVSRRGHTYKKFQSLCEFIADHLKVRDAVIDGEIVCLNQNGQPRFDDLMYRRRDPHFYAFDLLWLNGEDLRGLTLLDRKAALKKILPPPSRVLYTDHIEGRGEELFRLVCERDLEGIVAKWKRGAYVQGERTCWIKIKNRSYTQIVGREDMFKKRV